MQVVVTTENGAMVKFDSWRKDVSVRKKVRTISEEEIKEITTSSRFRDELMEMQGVTTIIERRAKFTVSMWFMPCNTTVVKITKKED